MKNIKVYDTEEQLKANEWKPDYQYVVSSPVVMDNTYRESREGTGKYIGDYSFKFNLGKVGEAMYTRYISGTTETVPFEEPGIYCLWGSQLDYLGKWSIVKPDIEVDLYYRYYRGEYLGKISAMMLRKDGFRPGDNGDEYIFLAKETKTYPYSYFKVAQMAGMAMMVIYENGKYIADYYEGYFPYFSYVDMDSMDAEVVSINPGEAYCRETDESVYNGPKEISFNEEGTFQWSEIGFTDDDYKSLLKAIGGKAMETGRMKINALGKKMTFANHNISWGEDESYTHDDILLNDKIWDGSYFTESTVSVVIHNFDKTVEVVRS